MDKTPNKTPSKGRRGPYNRHKYVGDTEIPRSSRSSRNKPCRPQEQEQIPRVQSHVNHTVPVYVETVVHDVGLTQTVSMDVAGPSDPMDVEQEHSGALSTTAMQIKGLHAHGHDSASGSLAPELAVGLQLNKHACQTELKQWSLNSSSSCPISEELDQHRQAAVVGDMPLCGHGHDGGCTACASYESGEYISSFDLDDNDDDDVEDDDTDTMTELAFNKRAELSNLKSRSEEEMSVQSDEVKDLSDQDPLLYPGSKLTVATSMLLTASFYIKRGLDKEGLADLLSLLELHCPIDNAFNSTISLFKQFFIQSDSPIVRHYYCTNCMASSLDASICSICQSSDIGSFVRVPLAVQLRNILERGSVLDSLGYRRERMKKGPDTIDDIFDGDLYNQHFNKNGRFKGSSNEDEQEIHISFQMNTDGVAIFKSSKSGVWPLYDTINELPPDLRYRRDNRFLLGLWYSEGKPDMKVFLQPFMEELVKLRTNGIQVQDKIVKGILLSTVADAPARCLLLNFTQFNGKHGCPCCYSEGTSHKVSERGYARIYPFEEPNGHGEIRTHQETLEIAKKVEQEYLSSNRASVVQQKGVKGYSPLMSLKYFDIIRGTGIDYMHCVILGTAKHLVHLWFDSCHSKENYSLRSDLKEINEKICSVKPPNLISRLPRSVDDFCHWKASEVRSFLLHYSVPILCQYMAETYLQHYVSLVSAIYILLQESISQHDIARARVMLAEFCKAMPTLYNVKEQTFNLHCLLHLCDKVQDLGPLWSQSCFFYESLNGDLRKLFHGSQNIDYQILFAVSFQMKVPELESKLKFGSPALKFYNKLVNHHHLTDNRERIDANWWALGPFETVSLEVSIYSKISNIVGSICDTFVFSRIQSGRVVYHSQKYILPKRRISYAVVYNSTKFGLVKCYIRCLTAVGVKYFAVIYPLVCEAELPVCEKIYQVQLAPVHEVIEVPCIHSICVFLKNASKDGKDFIAKFPNLVEKD